MDEEIERRAKDVIKDLKDRERVLVYLNAILTIENGRLRIRND